MSRSDTCYFWVEALKVNMQLATLPFPSLTEWPDSRWWMLCEPGSQGEGGVEQNVQLHNCDIPGA